MISSGERLVLAFNVESFFKSSFIKSQKSFMGTDGNRAVASKLTSFSFGLSWIFFSLSARVKEFLQVNGLFSEAGFSGGDPLQLLIRWAGKSFWGLWALIAGLAVGVRLGNCAREVDVFIGGCIYFFIFMIFTQVGLKFALLGGCGI